MVTMTVTTAASVTSGAVVADTVTGISHRQLQKSSASQESATTAFPLELGTISPPEGLVATTDSHGPSLSDDSSSLVVDTEVAQVTTETSLTNTDSSALKGRPGKHALPLEDTIQRLKSRQHGTTSEEPAADKGDLLLGQRSEMPVLVESDCVESEHRLSSPGAERLSPPQQPGSRFSPNNSHSKRPKSNNPLYLGNNSTACRTLRNLFQRAANRQSCTQSKDSRPEEEEEELPDLVSPMDVSTSSLQNMSIDAGIPASESEPEQICGSLSDTNLALEEPAPHTNLPPVIPEEASSCSNTTVDTEPVRECPPLVPTPTDVGENHDVDRNTKCKNRGKQRKRKCIWDTPSRKKKKVKGSSSKEKTSRTTEPRGLHWKDHKDIYPVMKVCPDGTVELYFDQCMELQPTTSSTVVSIEFDECLSGCSNMIFEESSPFVTVEASSLPGAVEESGFTVTETSVNQEELASEQPCQEEPTHPSEYPPPLQMEVDPTPSVLPLECIPEEGCSSTAEVQNELPVAPDATETSPEVGLALNFEQYITSQKYQPRVVLHDISCTDPWSNLLATSDHTDTTCDGVLQENDSEDNEGFHPHIALVESLAVPIPATESDTTAQVTSVILADAGQSLEKERDNPAQLATEIAETVTNSERESDTDAQGITVLQREAGPNVEEETDTPAHVVSAIQADTVDQEIAGGMSDSLPQSPYTDFAPTEAEQHSPPELNQGDSSTEDAGAVLAVQEIEDGPHATARQSSEERDVESSDDTELCMLKAKLKARQRELMEMCGTSDSDAELSRMPEEDGSACESENMSATALTAGEDEDTTLPCTGIDDIPSVDKESSVSKEHQGDSILEGQIGEENSMEDNSITQYPPDAESCDQQIGDNTASILLDKASANPQNSANSISLEPQGDSESNTDGANRTEPSMTTHASSVSNEAQISTTSVNKEADLVKLCETIYGTENEPKGKSTLFDAYGQTTKGEESADPSKWMNSLLRLKSKTEKCSKSPRDQKVKPSSGLLSHKVEAIPTSSESIAQIGSIFTVDELKAILETSGSVVQESTSNEAQSAPCFKDAKSHCSTDNMESDEVEGVENESLFDKHKTSEAGSDNEFCELHTHRTCRKASAKKRESCKKSHKKGKEQDTGKKQETESSKVSQIKTKGKRRDNDIPSRSVLSRAYKEPSPEKFGTQQISHISVHERTSRSSVQERNTRTLAQKWKPRTSTQEWSPRTSKHDWTSAQQPSYHAPVREWSSGTPVQESSTGQQRIPVVSRAYSDFSRSKEDNSGHSWSQRSRHPSSEKVHQGYPDPISGPGYRDSRAHNPMTPVLEHTPGTHSGATTQVGSSLSNQNQAVAKPVPLLELKFPETPIACNTSAASDPRITQASRDPRLTRGQAKGLQKKSSHKRPGEAIAYDFSGHQRRKSEETSPSSFSGAAASSEHTLRAEQDAPRRKVMALWHESLSSPKKLGQDPVAFRPLKDNEKRKEEVKKIEKARASRDSVSGDEKMDTQKEGATSGVSQEDYQRRLHVMLVPHRTLEIPKVCIDVAEHRVNVGGLADPRVRKLLKGCLGNAQGKIASESRPISKHQKNIPLEQIWQQTARERTQDGRLLNVTNSAKATEKDNQDYLPAFMTGIVPKNDIGGTKIPALKKVPQRVDNAVAVVGELRPSKSSINEGQKKERVHTDSAAIVQRHVVDRQNIPTPRKESKAESQTVTAFAESKSSGESSSSSERYKDDTLTTHSPMKQPSLSKRQSIELSSATSTMSPIGGNAKKTDSDTNASIQQRKRQSSCSKANNDESCEADSCRRKAQKSGQMWSNVLLSKSGIQKTELDDQEPYVELGKANEEVLQRMQNVWHQDDIDTLDWRKLRQGMADLLHDILKEVKAGMVYADRTSNLQENRVSLIKSENINPDVRQELLLEEKLFALKNRIAQTKSSQIANRDERLAVYEVDYEMRMKEMEKLRKYSKSSIVEVLPNEFRLGVEENLFISVEGCLFLLASTLTEAACERLYALKKMIQMTTERLKNLHEDQENLGHKLLLQLGWLHSERKHVLSEYCVAIPQSKASYLREIDSRRRWCK